jgi:hypothetical protein
MSHWHPASALLFCNTWPLHLVFPTWMHARQNLFQMPQTWKPIGQPWLSSLVHLFCFEIHWSSQLNYKYELSVGNLRVQMDEWLSKFQYYCLSMLFIISQKYFIGKWALNCELSHFAGKAALHIQNNMGFETKQGSHGNPGLSLGL